MKKQNGAKPGLPPGARAEVLEVLFTNMEINGDEISAILKKHHVSYDADALQDRYRSRWANGSWPACGMPPGNGRSCPMAGAGMSCWSAAETASNWQLSAGEFKTRRMA